ncbi:GNAT family N-acetyltransferase [Streptomyces griseosporeus]|uniref:GNAT family N-acetyltransferase n=1 Tax=Streptomyces griseosporeus TaxID=1910 RepID=UPI003700A78C
MSDRREQEVTVRPARPADLPGLVASSAALFAEDAGTRDPAVNTDWPRTHGADAFTAALDDPARLLLVAECGDEVVGHLSGSLTPASAVRPVPTATLAGLYVRPAYRRARTGTRLVEAFLAWAKERGAGQAEVSAYVANTDAVRFYERHGFGAHSVTLRHPL